VFNVLLVLGLCAVVAPLAIHRQVWRREVPIMIAASVLLLLFGLDRRIDVLESVALLAALVVHTGYSVVASRREPPEAQAEAAHGERLDRPARGGWPASLFLVLGGLAALVLGARWLVDAAVAIARGLGVTETVIGLTIVAAGTSLPEAAASLVATLRGEREIAVGNVVGSNVFNALGIVGVSGLLAGGDLAVHPSLAGFDLPFMVAVAIATLPLFFTDRRLARWEGALFLAYYAAYTVYLVLRSTEHDALPYYSAVAFEFVLPITGLTILVLAWRAVRAERSRVVWKPGGRE
jgi:cation:H+ antiporter